MTPFIKYLLLHPSPSPEHILTASHLHSSLLTLAQTTPPHPTLGQAPSLLILRTLLHILPLAPTHNDQLMQLASSQLQDMVRLGRQCGDRETMAALLDGCLAMCCGLSGRGLPLEPLLRCVLQLTTGENEVQCISSACLSVWALWRQSSAMGKCMAQLALFPGPCSSKFMHNL